MRPPSLRLLKERIALKFRSELRGEAQYGDHGTPGNLRAAISAPEIAIVEIGEQRVTLLRCWLVVRANPTLDDPSGRPRILRKDDGVLWDTHLWIALGPMEVEASNSLGFTVAWRFDMERVA